MQNVDTTVGKVLLKQILPPDLHEFVDHRTMTTDGINDLMEQVAEKHPDEYKDILQKLNKLGADTAATYGRKGSLDLDSLIPPQEVRQLQEELNPNIREVVVRDLPEEVKKQQILDVLEQGRANISGEIQRYFHDTPFGLQAASGVKAGMDNAIDIIAGEIMAVDEEGEVLPYAITTGFIDGLSPLEYWLSAQKARTGLIGTKLATPEAGDLSKQLLDAAQRIRITQEHEPEEYREGLGIPIDIDDPDYEGSVISQPIEGVVESGTYLTPEVIKHLKEEDIDEVIVHSPITSFVQHGISRDSLGDSTDYDYKVGDFVGNIAASSITADITQAAISSKHVGARRHPALVALKQLISVPKKFKDKASIAHKSGYVESITQLDDGSTRIKIGSDEEIVPPEIDILVTKGDKVEKGDVLSDGLPNPREYVEMFGTGGGRYHFSKILTNMLEEAGVSHNKRLTEILSRALINHVEFTDRYDGYFPGDIVEVADALRDYEKEDDTREETIKAAKGKYLQEPALYHLPGTQIDDHMIKEFKKHGLKDVSVSDKEPPFKPIQRPAMGALSAAEDPLLRMYGSSAKKNLLESMYLGKGITELDRPTSLIAQLTTSGFPKPLDEDTASYDQVSKPSLDLDQIFAD